MNKKFDIFDAFCFNVHISYKSNFLSSTPHGNRMYKKNAYITICVCAVVLLVSCTATSHRKAVQDDSGDKLTVGTVQREITIGMPASDVVEILGAPNIVTTDEERREVWVWDKIYTNVVHSRSSGVIAGLIIGGSGGGAGLANMASGAASTSQRTLTVIIKFDSDSKVRDFSYRTSSF